MSEPRLSRVRISALLTPRASNRFRVTSPCDRAASPAMISSTVLLWCSISTPRQDASKTRPPPGAPSGRATRMRAVFAFGSHDQLDAETLLRAPVRWPRPSRLEEPLTFPHAKAAEAGEALGLLSVGALLNHLPRGTGEARTVVELQPDE